MSSNFARISIRPDNPNADEPALDARAEAAEVFQVNDTAPMAADESGNVQYRRSLSINLSESREQIEVNYMERERDRFQTMVDDMYKPDGTLKVGATYQQAEAYKAKVRQLEDEIATWLDVGAATRATRMSQVPAHLAGVSGIDTPKLKSGVGDGINQTLEEIASDPDHDPHVRAKAEAALKRYRR